MDISPSFTLKPNHLKNLITKSNKQPLVANPKTLSNNKNSYLSLKKYVYYMHLVH